MKTIYLAGPMNDCTEAEASDWRDQATMILKNGFKVLNPMDRDYRGKNIEFSYREIVDLDKIDVRQSDIVLANCHKPSVGTSMEILYAWELGKIVIVVAPSISVSPWLMYHSTYLCHDVHDALRWINDKIAE